MPEAVDSGIDGSLGTFGRRDVRDGELAVAMRFFHRGGERGVIKDGKSREADAAAVLDKDLDVVGAPGYLPGHESCRLAGSRDGRGTGTGTG